MEDKDIVPAVLMEIRHLRHKPIWEFDMNNRNDGSLESIEQKLKDSVGYKLGNKHQYLNAGRFGHYSFLVSSTDNKNWSLYLWDSSGTVALHNWKIPIIDRDTDVFSSEIVEDIWVIIKEYQDGIVKCGGCNTKMWKNEKGGTYFAATLCVDCWEKDYKHRPILD